MATFHTHTFLRAGSSRLLELRAPAAHNHPFQVSHGSAGAVVPGCVSDTTHSAAPAEADSHLEFKE